jgi:diguanylate cyclase (GGDEF)-like protein
MSRTLVDRSYEDASLYDPLTGLPGRLLQRAHLVQALKRANRDETQVAVLFLDVEDFSSLNARIGRELADQVLVVLAGRIQDALRDSDMTARLEGDEFVIVCEGLRAEEDLHRIVRRVAEVASMAMVVGDHAVEVRVTTGAALSTGADGAGALMNAANRDMVRSRQG